MGSIYTGEAGSKYCFISVSYMGVEQAHPCACKCPVTTFPGFIKELLTKMTYFSLKIYRLFPLLAGFVLRAPRSAWTCVRYVRPCLRRSPKSSWARIRPLLTIMSSIWIPCRMLSMRIWPSLSSMGKYWILLYILWIALISDVFWPFCHQGYGLLTKDFPGR